jgi:hypothetical protein
MAYQMMKGKKGNNDGFPSIPGMIARYSALGLTNEEMSKNPVWKDLTGNGHDLQMKNFAWGGMSGVGGYSDNFSSDSWKKPSDRSDITWTSSSFNITRVMNTGVQIYYFSKWEESESVIPEKRIIVKGLEDGQVLRYMNVGNRIIEISQDGIYTIPSFTFKGANSYHGYSLAKKQESCNVTVEQLPLYPGALVFDGVDDYGICNNFPILTKEKGYTVVALRQWLSRPTDSIYGLISNTKNWFTDGAFIFEYQNNSKRGTTTPISFGQTSVRVLQSGVLSYQTSLKYNEFSIVPGNFEASERLIVGSAQSARHFANAAIWEICILDHDATEEELTNIKDYFVKTYPWLFPDQAWTVTGKTNEDTDRATIANITGNGNDLILSNFGFAEGSGYNEEGEYAGYLVTDGVDDSGRAVNVTTEKDFTLVGEWKLFSDTSNNAGLSIHPQIHIFNRPESIRITFRSAGKTLPVKSLKAICSDGRCYDKDWNELHINVGNFTNNTGTLFVGSNGGNYTKTAFKNLSLYNNQIFSKEDCIKAYNYLQTLKAK